MLDDILFVLVTCTQDESRKRGLEACIKTLNAEHQRVPFNGNLIVFDNASFFKEPLKDLRVPAVYAMSPENVGYWGALHWVNHNVERLLGKSFPYIHPIESDFVLYDIDRLADARRVLAAIDDLHTIRTQEFSIRWKSAYFKRSLNPFRVKRSHVANHNVVTGEKVRFTRVPGAGRVYLTNWHAKVPALHKFGPFKDTIEELAGQDQLSELDFMKAMHRRRQGVGLLDGGIWWMHLAELSNKKEELSGSFSSDEMLKKFNYRTTRVDFIPKAMPEIKVSRSPA